jgi:hypothetical protein
VNEMDDVWMRMAGNLVDRIRGPMSFRFVLQPVVASIFAIFAGLRDARAHRPPYLWALVTSPGHRGHMIRDAWESVGKVFVVALVLDVVYQVLVFNFVYSGEALIVGFVLTIAPYLIVRGLANRLASRT